MSTVKTNNVQIGQSVTATNNFTWYQPSTPDGTVRLGNGNAGSVTDLVTLTSAGNLGIGTSSPSSFSGYHYLSIDGTTGSVLNLRSNGTSQFEINTTTSDNNISGLTALPLVFKTNNSERMRLDSSGNLGLGVTPKAWGVVTPAFDLGVTGGMFSYSNQFASIYNGYYNGANWIYKTSGAASQYAQNGGVHSWQTAPSGTAGNAISFTQAMTLDASGNLLVGTTSKSSVVGVNSKFSAGLATLGSVAGGGTGAVDTGISINAGGAGGTILFLASRNVGAGTQTASAIYMITLYYDGNNAPTATFISGTNFCTFGVSGSNTLTVTNSGSGNASYSWFINK